MPISHKPDLNTHFIHLRFPPGFSPVNKTVLIFALQKQSWSREDIKDLLGFTGSNQLEQMGTKHTSEITPLLAPQALAWPSCHQRTPLTPRAAAGGALALGSAQQLFLSTCRSLLKGPMRSALGPPGTHACPPRPVGAAKQELTTLGLWNQSGSDKGNHLGLSEKVHFHLSCTRLTITILNQKKWGCPSKTSLGLISWQDWRWVASPETVKESLWTPANQVLMLRQVCGASLEAGNNFPWRT